MELTGLLPVLAWLQILPRLVLSTGTEGPSSSPGLCRGVYSQSPTPVPAPPAPSLSLSPPSPVRGQQVQLTCSAPRDSGALGFVFYEQRNGSWDRLSSQSSGTWRISMENSELSRTFTCSYWVQSSPPRQPHSQSLPSNAVTLLLTAWSLPIPLVAGCSGAATALALLLLLICLCRKKVAASCQLSMSDWKRGELCRSWIARRSAEISELSGVTAETHAIPLMTLHLPAPGSEPQPYSADPGPPLMFGSLSFRPVYVNIPFRASTALQQWSHDGQAQLVTHNQPAQPNNPGGKPGVGQNPQERVKREEAADATEGHNSSVSNPVYSMVTPSSAVAQQRGGKYISEAVVYSEIPY
ncbi:uncharacterized protein LOC115637985 isoform X2 [Gopherus evgoodei]|uniref:uncharacterized protein LOC115637985 isoform X2 n=1 Tax=Gopherus evgoodei TaxID=1825980 RepID=UPI0011CFF20F|nr:uncharacterized protein LOC115637985 isoform X2 [Gopherus evgoodei]